MSATQFVQSLLETGRVKVPLEADGPEGLEQAVAELDQAARAELAGEPPALSVAAAAWALKLTYRAAQALVFREIAAAAVQQALAQPCPQPRSPSVEFSADLSLRYLSDLLSLARGVAPDDPLVTGLARLAREWPLSSVGAAGLAEVDPPRFMDHPGLRQLYVDRIIERGDAARLEHPDVHAAVRESVGAYPELAPKLAGALGR